MRGVKRIGLLSLVVAAALFVQNAAAGPVDFLPGSRHYQGRAYYNMYTDEGLLRGRIDFAVYDTLTYPDEFVGAGGFTAPGAGRYIYAYQLFCDTGSTVALEYFAVFEMGAGAIDDDDGIGSRDDGHGGLEPFNAFFNPDPEPVQAAWEFDESILVADEHSYFLVLTSDHGRTKGDYHLIPSGGDLPAPGSGVPEPGALTLLGLGGILMVMRRRKSVQ